MTFSIVAWDPTSNPPEWGVAVASKFLAVGALVPWARAGAGALATQAFANLSYGPEGIELLASDRPADQVVAALTGPDEERGQRQLGVVDAHGAAATFTGEECFEWAGGLRGDGYCCQGNILAGPQVVNDMASAFEGAAGDLAQRLLAALAAGDAAGGDRRGRQSAAMKIVREGGGYGGGVDLALDLRVDDDADPVAELTRLLDLHRLYFPRPEELEFVALDEALVKELRALLSDLGYATGEGDATYEGELKAALFAFAGTENLEERWSEGEEIERRVLEHLRARAASS